MNRLVALKDMTYATRRLRAGETFEAKPREAKILLALKKARAVEGERATVIPPPPPEVIQQAAAVTPPAAEQVEPEDEMARLRSEAEQLGIQVDGRWGARRLQAEIEQARQQP